MGMELVQEAPYRFRIDRYGQMRAPGFVFASRELLPGAGDELALRQVANVATLPGIVGASYAMPDIHSGYGFPIGGVAATDEAGGGVVSPGGVGFDISCGVRLLAASCDREEVAGRLDSALDRLDRGIPRGTGRGAVWGLTGRERLGEVLIGGSRYVVGQGYGHPRDLERCEDSGAVVDADPAQVSEQAQERGRGQVGSLGAGNHFLEVQAVEEVLDEPVAAAFGLRAGQVCVMIHCGSRGLGHQICTEHVARMRQAMPEYGIEVPDPQLACAPVRSHHGLAYLGAMAAAANYARANRQVLTEVARRVVEAEWGADLDLVYDVSHNLAKMEDHTLSGRSHTVCVHRKGATRALPPGHPELPDDLTDVGQPVLVPGSMGTGSYVLVGVPGAGAFASTCHGAGRVRSRHQAAREVDAEQLRRSLRQRGIGVRGTTVRGLVEEAPEAYKDIDAVVEAAEGAGLGRRVARLVPIGVVKG